MSNVLIAFLAEACPQLSTCVVSHCQNITDLTPLGKCTELDCLVVEGCTGITDTTIIQLAATAGEQLHVFAQGSGVTAAVLDSLKGSTRICVYLG